MADDYVKEAIRELRHAALAAHEDAREMYLAGALMFMRKAVESETEAFKRMERTKNDPR